MNNYIQLSDVEQWQQSEEDRLEYEGYCNKIRKGLEDLDDKSGERAIWELVQNARDVSQNARIKIELKDSQLTFSHHGEPFDYTSFYALVKQDSAKDRNGADLVGQYGTGFMTTHAFNRKVYVSGPFVVKKGENDIIGYVQIKDFELDRSQVDTTDGPKAMKCQLDNVKEFWKLENNPTIIDDTTSFRYELSQEQAEEISNQLSKSIRLMPFVLAINSRIQEIEIDNLSEEHITFKRQTEKEIRPFNDRGWNIVEDTILAVNHKCDAVDTELKCKSLQSDKGDVILLPPYHEMCGGNESIPSLFLWFPLLGTEKFGVNFIFHSSRFHPVEKRNNIMIPASTPTKREKGGANSSVLKEMTQVLFDYCKQDENAKSLTRQLCEVSFPLTNEDEETRAFFDDMQNLWNAKLPDWKVLPIGDSYYSVSDNRVKLLHPDFYSRLEEGLRDEYEATLAKYAQYPNMSDGTSYLMPSADLIAWSEIVDRWRCNRDSEFFVTVKEVCNAIKNKGYDLHKFLMLMKDGGNAKVMEDYPLLPNREGELRKKSELYYNDFMSDEVYELVKEVMGDDRKKIYDPEFLDVCKVNDYTISDLQKAISSTMTSWRKEILDATNKTLLTDERLDALILFCSASYIPDSTNVRCKTMPLIASYFSKEFAIIQTIKFKNDNEEDFYSTAFNLLLDYTLYRVSLEESSWVVQNKEWLKSFLSLYSPSTNTDHYKRLDDYGVLPNRLNELCLKKDLHKNAGVPEEMAKLYEKVFNKDLHEVWVVTEFEDVITLPEDKPKEIANLIETSLVADMKQEKGDRKFEREVREIVLKIAESKEWEEWFGQINDKKATYTFSMQSGNAQKSLFTLMDIGDDNLGRLAKLTAKGDVNGLLDRMERQQELERNNKARFAHLQAIGNHIEKVLMAKMNEDFVMVDKPAVNGNEAIAEDVQNGQDIIIKVKIGEEWKDVFYVEVKSKWDFSEPAHMSTRQVRMASLHPDEYALCCVDLRAHKNEDLENLPSDVILGCTRVKMNIGEELGPMMKAILEADNRSEDEQIKISDYRSNMSAKVFEVGVGMDELMKKIEGKVRQCTNRETV